LLFWANKRIYERCSQFWLLKLMQSCNHWMNDCLDHSITCGFMAAHSSIICCHIFSGAVGWSWYTMPFRVSHTKNPMVCMSQEKVRVKSWSTMTNSTTRIYSNKLYATSTLCTGHPSCWYHIHIWFLNGMHSERRGRMFNKNVVYLSPFRFPSIKWGPLMCFLVTPHHMFKLHWRLCSTCQSHHRFTMS
jgi:hypothetical protein